MRAAPFPATAFVTALARTRIESSCNPWSNENGEDGSKRRQALIEHLSTHNPKFLFISDHGVVEDVASTGIPLCCEYTFSNGDTVAAATHARRAASSFSAEGVALWRSLIQIGIADRCICFSLMPFLMQGKRLTDTRWAINIARWYPDITVIGTSRVVCGALNAFGIDSHFILQPGSPGFRGLLQARIQRDLQ